MAVAPAPVEAAEAAAAEVEVSDCTAGDPPYSAVRSE